MLSLHALLIFIFCASAVAPPPPPPHGASTPYPLPKIPGKAKRPFYRVNIPPNVTVSGITFNPNSSVSY